MQPGKNQNSRKTKGNISLYITFFISLALILSYFFISPVEEFFNDSWEVLTSNDEKRIKNWVDQFGYLGPVIIILAMVFQIVLLMIPTILLMVVSILAYGPIAGSLIIFVSIFTASTVAFMIGRYVGPMLVENLIGKKTEKKVTGFLERYGFWAIIIFRINPFLSNDAISLVAGILKMAYWKFIGATLVGIAPLTIFIAIIGETTTGLRTGLLWSSIISLFLFLLYLWWDNKRKNKAG